MQLVTLCQNIGKISQSEPGKTAYVVLLLLSCLKTALCCIFYPYLGELSVLYLKNAKLGFPTAIPLANGENYSY